MIGLSLPASINLAASASIGVQDYTPLSLPIYAVSAPNHRQSARVKAFVDYMADALAQAPELQPIKSPLCAPATIPAQRR